MTAGTVLVVGSLNRDYTCVVDRLPAPGETVPGERLEVSSGGKGGNQAVAAALVGAPYGVRVALVGAVGSDPGGRALLDGLEEAGVDVDDVEVVPDEGSGAALITVRRDGENTIVVAPGANHAVAAEAVTDAVRRRAPQVVLVQGELLPAIVGAALRAAAEVGARPVLNLAPYLDLEPELLALCDPLVVNESEAGAVLDRSLGVDADLTGAADELAGRARSVVLTAGADGAYVADRRQVHHVAARMVPVRETTGAGDAFTGALGVALALGHPLVEAASWGAAAGAHAVQQRGARLRLGEGVRIADEV